MSEQEKKQNTVAEVLVKCLENEGVKYVFGIPGEENLDMMNALEKSNIRVIVVRHEQGLHSWQICMDGLPERRACAFPR